MDTGQAAYRPVGNYLLEQFIQMLKVAADARYQSRRELAGATDHQHRGQQRAQIVRRAVAHDVHLIKHLEGEITPCCSKSHGGTPNFSLEDNQDPASAQELEFRQQVPELSFLVRR